MMMDRELGRPSLPRALMLVIAVFWVCAPNGSASSLHPSFLAIWPSASARDASVPGFAAFVPDEISTYPIEGHVTATQGESVATTSYALTDSGLLITFDHSAAGRAGSGADGGITVSFWTSREIDFVLSGKYTSTAVDSIGMVLAVGFRGGGSLDHLVLNSQASGLTTGTTFRIGESAGADHNTMEGSLKGTLRAFESYEIWVNARISPRFDSSAPASGTGHVHLAFVPEPGTALLVGLGLALMSRRASSGGWRQRDPPADGAPSGRWTDTARRIEPGLRRSRVRTRSPRCGMISKPRMLGSRRSPEMP